MLTRIITGVVGIAAAIAIITKGGVVFSGAVLLLALIGWHEYHKWQLVRATMCTRLLRAWAAWPLWGWRL